MSESRSSSGVQKAFGVSMIVIGVGVFAVRLLHEGAYPFPRGGNLFGGVGALALGVAFLLPGLPRAALWGLRAVAPVVLFFAVYAIGAELEETISLYAVDSAGGPAELRLWVVDRDDGEWVGMPRAKAVEHSLDGARVERLRRGEVRCVTPVLYEDRPTVKSVHAQKVEKYGVARAAAAIGLYPREASDAAVALRFDPCPAGSS